VRSTVLIDPKGVVKAACPGSPARATPQRCWRPLQAACRLMAFFEAIIAVY